MRGTDFRNGGNGRVRGERGRFAPGNDGGPGRPPGCENELTAASMRFKTILVETAEKHFPAIVQALVKKAKGGDEWAIRELLDRLLGKVKPEAPAPPVATVAHKNNVFMTMTPEQQARIDELAKIGFAKIALERAEFGDEDD